MVDHDALFRYRKLEDRLIARSTKRFGDLDVTFSLCEVRYHGHRLSSPYFPGELTGYRSCRPGCRSRNVRAMPSELHEALLLLFRDRPALAPELLRDALHVDLPAFTEAHIDSADFTEVKPAEYRADLVVLLRDGVPVYGIVVEAQLQQDARKKFVWPVYATSLRARLEVPVSVLVITADDATARWAAQSIQLGPGSSFRPLVLGPSGVPAIVDEEQARAHPELAVFSALAHGRDKDPRKAARVARAAHMATLVLDAERGWMYFDLVFDALSEAAQKELGAMDPAKYQYRSAYAKHWAGLGRVELLQRLLTRRFGPLSAEAAERLSAATIEELDAIGERLLTAQSLDEALGPPA